MNLTGHLLRTRDRFSPRAWARCASRVEACRLLCAIAVGWHIYCTLAVTDALAFSVNVHVFVLFPPLEQAPDQIASRPFVTLSVTEVPTLNDVDPVLPTVTLMPAGRRRAHARRSGPLP